MPLTQLRIAGYRSIQDLRLPISRITVVLGANGSGKTNLYRALSLLNAASDGTLARSLADDGGLPSVLWAGRRRQGVRARITISAELDDLSYEINCGPVPPPDGPFKLDPEVKEETISALRGTTRHVVAQRKAGTAWLFDADGARTIFPFELWNGESLLAQLSEPHRFPLLSALRSAFLRWRFYHRFRTDPDSPVRLPRAGVRTPALAADGRDLAAALMTVQEIGDAASMREAVSQAFPGASLDLIAEEGRFSFRLSTTALSRPLDARELSDGTIQYLCLTAVLLSPRTPPFLALNEPETSLHTSLLQPLADLVATAGERGQILLTTHSEELAAALASCRGTSVVRLEMVDGATRIAN